MGSPTPAVIGSLVLVAQLVGCGPVEFDSRWRDREIVIDGDLGEWSGATTYVEDADAAVGFLNDGTDLYLALGVYSEMEQRQIMLQGLTVWFDPRGGKDKVLGVRFPLGVSGALGERSPGERQTPDERPSPGERPSPDERPAPAGPEGDDERRGPPDAADMVRRAKARETHLEILIRSVSATSSDPVETETLDSTRLPLGEAPGIEAAFDISRSRLIYELRIPLAKGSGTPYAIGVAPGQSIGVGLDSPKPDIEDLRAQRGDRGPGGMDGAPPMGRPGGGAGMGPPGGMGGRLPGGGRMGMPEAIDVWAKVLIADGPEDATAVRESQR